ncbi:MAG: citrate/2-methylcitrate synthase [Candidatus Thorarchaeota archaeon]|jgi:citrate synthase
MEPISRIDPQTNQLYFRGIDATVLASNTDYESVLFLLVNGKVPSKRERKKLVQKMNKLRDLHTKDIQSLEELINRLPNLKKEHGFDLHDTLLTFVTLSPMIIANQFARSRSIDAELPDSKLGHAANFLWMVGGITQMQAEVIDFQTTLILPMDDPDNPSLSALTQALEKGDESDALRAALKAHVGPLHHGAGTLAMAMFEEIQKRDAVKEYLERKITSGGIIYGLGHRIYTGIDPRAVVLRKMLERRTTRTSDEWILHVSDAVAAEGRILLSKHKNIDAFPNIDLYNAAVYSTFGFPPELNTSFFAVSRAAGWMAHILELKSD